MGFSRRAKPNIYALRRGETRSKPGIEKNGTDSAGGVGPWEKENYQTAPFDVRQKKNTHRRKTQDASSKRRQRGVLVLVLSENAILTLRVTGAVGWHIVVKSIQKRLHPETDEKKRVLKGGGGNPSDNQKTKTNPLADSIDLYYWFKKGDGSEKKIIS